MKYKNSQHSIYTYLKINTKEDWKSCFNQLSQRFKNLGFIYDKEMFGDNSKEPSDYYDNGWSGAPLNFIKKVRL